MYIDFEKLPKYARIWIYQADRLLDETEEIEIQQIAKDFVENWDSHGATVEGSFALKHHRFLILASNEDLNAPSGCSIDKSVKLVRSIGQKYQIDFFNRTNVVFRHDDDLKTAPMNALKTKISQGELKADSLVFDNMIQQKKDLQNWEKPAQKTWLKRYF